MRNEEAEIHLVNGIMSFRCNSLNYIGKDCRSHGDDTRRELGPWRIMHFFFRYHNEGHVCWKCPEVSRRSKNVALSGVQVDGRPISALVIIGCSPSLANRKRCQFCLTIDKETNSNESSIIDCKMEVWSKLIFWWLERSEWILAYLMIRVNAINELEGVKITASDAVEFFDGKTSLWVALNIYQLNFSFESDCKRKHGWHHRNEAKIGL